MEVLLVVAFIVGFVFMVKEWPTGPRGGDDD